MTYKFFGVLLFTSLISSGPVLAQEYSLTSALNADAKSTFTEDKTPGAHLIPGTKANPLASPDSLPGHTKILLQPNVEMTTHEDHGMNDDASYSKTLIDLLEYSPDADSNMHWDIERWQGGDYHRWWFKTEGERGIRSGDYDAEFQLLKSKLTHSYTEFQYGLRLETRHSSGSTVARPQAVVGFQSLMPYNYELETGFYVDLQGNVSASMKAEKDLLITQKLILQPRVEADAALQQVDRFGVGSGLNNVDFGLRLRYEISREFAPYIGVDYEKAFGKTASFVRQEGGDPGKWQFVAGVRMWF